MLNQSCLQNAIAKYKDEFDEFQWKNEKYKWEAVKWFQDHWNANSPDFAGMPIHLILRRCLINRWQKQITC